MEDDKSAEMRVTEYICNSCKHENRLTPKDPIRCSNCGKHILCKKRDPNHVVQLQAI
ncbi:hypothetical protein NUSPORA_00134 [Nucleospora cyclopteri]